MSSEPERSAAVHDGEAAHEEERDLPVAAGPPQHDLEALRLETERIAREVDVVRDRLATVSTRLTFLESATLARNPFRRLGRALARRRFVFDPVPAKNLRRVDASGRWEAVGTDQTFELVSLGKRFPRSWVRLDFEVERDADAVTRPSLTVDCGGHQRSFPLPHPREGRIQTTIPLPAVAQAFRLDVVEPGATVRLGTLAMREIGRLEVGLRSVLQHLRSLGRHPGGLEATLRAAIAALRRSGLQGIKDWLVGTDEPPDAYGDWVEEFDTLTAADRSAIRARVSALPRTPRISVIMPVYETAEPWLRRAIESVREQLYAEWELCIADDASKAPHVRRVLEEYAARDPRIRVVFRQQNGHISEASNDALALARGDYVALLDHDDELAPHALYLVAEELNAHPEADLVYSDEDKLDRDGRRRDPYFKPDWSPDLILSQNLFSHLGVYRTDLVRRVGGFRRGFEGSQDYDLLLRCMAETTAERIRHIPHVLYHWRAIAGSTAFATAAKSYAEPAAMKALTEHLARTDPRIRVARARLPTTYRITYPLPAPPPLVSMIVPTRDALPVLRRCVESVLATTTYPRFEMLIVDNRSRDPRTLTYLASLADDARVRVLHYDRPFNYAAINNFAAREAAGDVLCLLNDDVEVITADWLTEMVAHALRPGIGAVGAKLLYPNETVQHAGIVTGVWGVAAHYHRHLPADAPGHRAHAQVVRNVSAVTGACLVVRRTLFEAVGGLDEGGLPVTFNDVDFCLRLEAAGYRNLWTPFAELYHNESYSRGADDVPAKETRRAREVDFMLRRWGRRLEADPYYSPNLSLASEAVVLARPPRAPRPWRATED